MLKFKSICLDTQLPKNTNFQCKWKINICLVRGVKTYSIVILSFKKMLHIIATQSINWRKSGKLGDTCYILITDNNWAELKQKEGCVTLWVLKSCCALSVTVTTCRGIHVMSLHLASSSGVSSQAAELEKFSYSHSLFAHSWLRQQEFYKNKYTKSKERV